MNINTILRAARRLSSLRLCAAITGLGASLVSTASAWTSADATTIFNAYNTAFYVANSGNAYYKNDTTGGRSGFWTTANMIEMAEDVYDRTGSSGTSDLITALCNGFISYNGTDWSGNIYNDDVMWASIAFSRAYLITGNTTFRDRAKANFDMVWSRAWSTDLGGGLWWTTAKGSKNACVNGPGAIAACYLYQITGTASYLTKAQQIFAWERSTLYNSTTGGIADNIGSGGTVNGGSLSYNQGTFIGAANFLYNLTGTRQYYQDAWLAAKFTRDSLCASDGRFYITGTAGADGSGFAGIGIRWIARFASEQRIWAYFYPWLKYNANLAWDVRRSDNLSWNQWATATPTGTRYAWECFPSVTALQVVPSTNPSPVFMLVNKNSGKSIDLIDGATANGSVINQWTYDYANLDQQWSFVPSEDGSHHIIVSQATGYQSGKVLCVQGNSTANGVQIHLWDYNEGTGQQWDLIYVSDGWYKIKNVNSGKVLEIAGASTADGAKLQQGTDTGSDAQLFRLHPVGDYFIRTLADKYVTMAGTAGANSAAIIQLPWQNTSAFKWHFYPNSDGWEQVSSNVNTSRAVSVDGGLTTEGTAAIYYDFSSTYQAEKIRLLPLTNGKFKFVFKHSGMVWDVYGGSSADNTPIKQYLSNSYIRQQFGLERTY